jgi:two-component system, NarL family, nitrate/nitrite response regulator NarL
VSIRVVLVDDHPIVLQGLEHLFARQPDIEVAACCLTVQDGLAAARACPDIVLLDLRMPDGGGLALLDTIAAEKIETKTVVLTAAISDEEMSQALQKGASGLVLKESSPDQLLECVRRVHAGERWLDPEAASRVVAADAPPKAPDQRAASLTAREREVVRMIASGLRNRDIGERLSISENTVKVHLHNIYEKLGVEGRMELLLLAQELKLV